MTQWLRKISIEYGRDVPGSTYGPRSPWTVTSEGNDDFRVQFSFSRTNGNRADSGNVRIFNLPLDYANAIRTGVQEANEERASILKDVRWRNDIDRRNFELRELAAANLVRITAGYQDETKQIFQGDITDLRVRMLGSDTDSVTSISLGDTVVPLKYGWLHKTFGGGSRLDQVLKSVVGAAANMSEQATEFLATTVAGVEVFEFRNGAIIQGGITRNIDALVARYGVQWFIRDGEFFMMPRKSLIDDFALRLDEGDNVLRPLGKVDGEDIQFTMLLDGDMLPGRGFKIFDTNGNPTSNFGYRADDVRYVGDTHGNPWYCIVQGSRLDKDLLVPFTALTPDQTFTFDSIAVP